MGARGPLLSSAIIFYLAIQVAIFEVLEEPPWKEAERNYCSQKLHLLKEFPRLGWEGWTRSCRWCLTLQARAASTARQTLNNWN